MKNNLIRHPLSENVKHCGQEEESRIIGKEHRGNRSNAKNECVGTGSVVQKDKKKRRISTAKQLFLWLSSE